ncbi:hypoxia-inducible factor 1-alpha-like isoform X1 [Athalia rosae]|uniref:hypoxia-inducible factor 1-alpha-like isoform X1 n=1 Tax=Athalia rosae TaxID=37344 RepID=UPI00203421D5|nr:hypoxia-inducible factor 1-alpha-like isoform X1 [Athalia rosae]
MYNGNEYSMWSQNQQQFTGTIPPQQQHSRCHPPSPNRLHRLEAHPLQQQRMDNRVLQHNHDQHQPHYHHHRHHGVMELPVPSNPRASRNMAEKQRRDNLNTNISTMAALVPAVAGSSRRMDKISILRLSAAFLRTQYTLGSGPASFLPQKYNDFDLEQYIIENLVANAGFFLVVTTSGKIVYISRHVEHQLGHAQNELLGQSLYNFVCAEDYEELTRNLTPDEMQSGLTNTSNAVKLTNDDNSNSSEDLASPKEEKKFTVQRRSFNIRMSQRTVNKRDHRQYECLHISGQLRLADACTNQGTTIPGIRSRHREINSTSNDIVFVGIARLLKRRTITELSLLEATKDEYVTRHLVDGRIIFCDHRISVVAGYMAEEVSGLSAFKFMHKEDVRWTMIALRQMYDRCEGFGTSCYRLLSKTGQFIYLRTHGYLEFDKTTQTVESFVCVNTLVAEKEGEELVKEMKDRFSATITGPAKAMITPSSSSTLSQASDSQRSDTRATVEDPLQLEDAITHLISDLPSPSVSEDRLSPSPLPNNQFYKAAIYSRGLPPASIQAHKIGIKTINHKSPSDKSSQRCKIEGQKRRESVTLIDEAGPTDLLENEEIAIAGPSFARPSQRVASPVRELSAERLANDSKIAVHVQDDETLTEVHEDRPPTDECFSGETLVDTNISQAIFVSDSTTISDHGIARSLHNFGTNAASVFKASADNSQERRAPRKRDTQGGDIRATGKTKQQNIRKKIPPIFSGSDFGSQKSVAPRIDSVVTSTCKVVQRVAPTNFIIQKEMNSGNPTSQIPIADYLRNSDQDSSTNKATRYTRKRSRSSETAIVSKRKANVAARIQNCPQDEGDMIFPAGANPEAKQNSKMSVNLNVNVNDRPMLGFGDIGSITGIDEMDAPTLIGSEITQILEVDRLAETPMELEFTDAYQHLNPSLLDSSDRVQENVELEDLEEDMLSPSLDADPDLMKKLGDLQSVMYIGKPIDEANVDQFTASDQAVSEGIRRTQFQLEKCMALRESQFNVLKRNLDNPALQTKRDNPALQAKRVELEAEHNKEKQILKTLQQDHLNIQANVQHNIGV